MKHSLTQVFVFIIDYLHALFKGMQPKKKCLFYCQPIYSFPIENSDCICLCRITSTLLAYRKPCSTTRCTRRVIQQKNTKLSVTQLDLSFSTSAFSAVKHGCYRKRTAKVTVLLYYTAGCDFATSNISLARANGDRRSVNYNPSRWSTLVQIGRAHV